MVIIALDTSGGSDKEMKIINYRNAVVTSTITDMPVVNSMSETADLLSFIYIVFRKAVHYRMLLIVCFMVRR